VSGRDAFFLHKSPSVFLNPLAEKHSEVQMGSYNNFLPQIHDEMVRVDPLTACLPEKKPRMPVTGRSVSVHVACRALSRASGPRCQQAGRCERGSPPCALRSAPCGLWHY
jgi:hypothetical protein